VRRTTNAVAAAMLLAVLATRAVLGQEVTDALRLSQPASQFNAHALGMGNTYSTIGYDISALSFNPATMALSRTFSWTVTTNVESFQSTTNYYGNRTHFGTNNTYCGQVGLTFPLRLDSTRNLIVGCAYTRSSDFGSGFKYAGLNDGSRFPSFSQVLANQADPTARALGLSYPTYDASGNFLGDNTILGDGLYETGNLLAGGGPTHYSLGAAIEATHNFFVGASGSYNTGNYSSDLELAALDVNDAYPTGVLTAPDDPRTDGFESAHYHVARDKQYRGWDARFGMMYKLADFIGLSASFHLPGPEKVSEDLFRGGTSRFAGSKSIVLPETRSTSTFYFSPPAELTVGAMVNMWIVTGTAEATYVDYTTVRITSGAGALPDRTLINKRINDELAAVLNLNLGAEVRLPFTGLSGRAGGIYQPSPYGSDPARNSRKVVTVGCGYNANDVAQVDLGYAYAWRGENRERQVGDDSSANRTVGFNTLLFTIRVAF